MFVFGVHIESQDVFERHCLPGIAANGGRDATLITTSDLPKVDACNDILDAAARMDNVDAVVLLQESTRITDPMFTMKVTEALASSEALDVFGPPSASDPGVPDPTCLVLRADVAEHLRFDAERFDNTHAPDGFEDDLIRRARNEGLAVGTVDVSVAQLSSPPARPLDLSGVDRFESASATWQGRAAHRITRALLERWREATPAAQRPVTDRAPISDAGSLTSSLPHGDYFTFEREQLVHHVPPDARRVLDLSAGAGDRGAAVKQRTGAYVVGIEPGSAMAEAARNHLDEVWQIDLNDAETLTTQASPEPFDVILVAGVLERLVDPEGTVRSLVGLLTDDGVLIATVPNVKHWSVILPLLIDDRFEYSPTGPIRPSSLRFYTMIEAAALLRRNGFDWCEATAATTVPLAEPSQIDPLVAALVTYGVNDHEARTLFDAYEFVLTARKNPPSETSAPGYGGSPAGE